MSFESARPRGVPTVLDALRVKIDPADFDGVLLWLEAVAADLGYADVRALPGSLAWIDRLRTEGIRLALASGGGDPARAAQLAGIEDRFEVTADGSRSAATTLRILDELGVAPERALVVDVAPSGLAAAREAGVALSIGLARGVGSPAALRDAGADAVVADLQELLGPTPLRTGSGSDTTPRSEPAHRHPG